jgi:hypothetical protein
MMFTQIIYITFINLLMGTAMTIPGVLKSGNLPGYLDDVPISMRRFLKRRSHLAMFDEWRVSQRKTRVIELINQFINHCY